MVKKTIIDNNKLPLITLITTNYYKSWLFIVRREGDKILNSDF
jgi:hypothetical protein